MRVSAIAALVSAMSVLAAAGGLANEAKRATDAADVRSSGVFSSSIAVIWEGWQEPLSGRLQSTGNRYDGSMSVSDGDVLCEGGWQRRDGAHGTLQMPGTWAIACSNGKAASGSFTSERNSSGSGKGKDLTGKAVSFSYGG